MAEIKPYWLHPLAWEEIEAADDWYFARSPEASAAFLVTLSEALETIARPPAGRSSFMARAEFFSSASRSPLSIWTIPM